VVHCPGFVAAEYHAKTLRRTHGGKRGLIYDL
jgi:hypothetical protein